MNIIKILIGLLGISLFPLSGIVRAQSDATSQLSELLSNFRTYQAKFNQITFDAQDRLIQQSHGRVMIMRPGRFRWEADSPTNQIIIINAKTLWLYDVDLSQVTQQPLAQKTNINPASLLSGSVKDLKQKFTITVNPTPDTATFQLVPYLGKSLNFNWIRLKFSKKQLTEMSVLNNLDERSIFEFSRIKVNAPLSSMLFEFKPSRCIDVVKQ